MVALTEVPHWSVFDFGDVDFLELWLIVSSLIARLTVSRLGAQQSVSILRTVPLLSTVLGALASGNVLGNSSQNVKCNLC